MRNQLASGYGRASLLDSGDASCVKGWHHSEDMTAELPESPRNDWLTILRMTDPRDSAKAFISEPTLYASVLDAPRVGIEEITT